jgi:glycosyltransferase involved in cell wall biosynthesis
MNVVINIKTLSKHFCYDQSFFVVDCICKIINAHPEHSFFLIADIDTGKFPISKNATIIDASPKSVSIILCKIWYAYKLPVLLKKYKADVFINMDCICSLKTKVPQCILVPDISFPDHTSYFKKNTPAFFEKATSIITFSQLVKNEICKQYSRLATEKVAVIYNGVDEILLHEDREENTKEKYTEGKEYFLYLGDINVATNLINLLKAFSFFKKRQKSNMQLIIATKAFAPENAFVKSLKTYKYKNDVKLVVELQEEELIKITAAAYVFIYALEQTGFYTPLLRAMQFEVPVITANSLVTAEICEDAALFTDPAIFENIADKMMLLFKDEDKRTELIKKGKKVVAKYPLSASNQLFWQNIVKSASSTC